MQHSDRFQPRSFTVFAVGTTLAIAMFTMFHSSQNDIFSKNFFSGNWEFSFPAGPSVLTLSLVSALVGIIFTERMSRWVLVIAALLPLLAICSASIFEDNWKDKTNTVLLIVQAVHATSLIVFLSPMTILRYCRGAVKPRLSIRQLLVSTYAIACLLWLLRTAWPHLHDAVMLKHVIQPQFNWWLIIVGCAFGLNSAMWHVAFSSSGHQFRSVLIVAAATMLLGYSLGSLFLSINARWDTTLRAANYAVHLGYTCSLLFQGTIIALFKSFVSPRHSPDSNAEANQSVHWMTSREAWDLQKEVPVANIARSVRHHDHRKHKCSWST